jgi:hypothetical protein
MLLCADGQLVESKTEAWALLSLRRLTYHTEKFQEHRNSHNVKLLEVRQGMTLTRLWLPDNAFKLLLAHGSKHVVCVDSGLCATGLH